MHDRMIAFSEINDVFHSILFATLICSARLFAAFSIFQATAKQVLQGRVYSGVALVIGVFIAVGQQVDMFVQFNGVNFFVLALKEMFIGTLLGFMAATVFWTAEGVGAMIDNVAGYNNVQQQNPLSSNSSTPISSLLLQLCVTLFYVFGGFLFLLDAIFETYRWWPVQSMVPMPAVFLERFVIHQTDTLMTQIVKIASPVLVVMLLIDLGFGLIAKTAGKLEPNSLAQPIKSATALLVLLLSLSIFVQQLSVSLSLADLKQQLHIWANLKSASP